ncbi:MAG: hypothetical protein KAW17_09540 [Candidatus Eisenbacteria sp.]|nr:hypothetical protein [Candidatus Eisenbacteria bacterium]
MNRSQKASPLVYFLAMLAMKQRDSRRPKVGEWAVEVTHLIGMGKVGRKMGVGHGLECAVGKVKKFVPDGTILELLDGTEQKWTNARLIALDV